MPAVFRPAQFVPVNAYLLDRSVPPEKMLLGLDTVLSSGFSLHVASSGNFLVAPDGSRIGLYHTNSADRKLPEFRVPRVCAALMIECLDEELEGRRVIQGVIVDTGVPYLTIPNAVHGSRRLKIYKDWGRKPYHVPARMDVPQWQRFVTVGIRFLERPLYGD